MPVHGDHSYIFILNGGARELHELANSYWQSISFLKDLCVEGLRYRGDFAKLDSYISNVTIELEPLYGKWHTINTLFLAARGLWENLVDHVFYSELNSDDSASL